ncbi:permease prefix domain 1-containing protein [Bengtsoniella intestinalis]|uniref:permease prefix domain 1-containing protein n=1 Tax=Bengtsoniella intestinalis TaxID=3073143 RepID=UPI00391F898B
MAKNQTPFEAFTQAVLGYIPRANGDEWHEIRDELTAHLEDRADALEARGMTPEDAQAQAILRMGDPKEIGQAINAELSVFWGWIGRLAAIAITVVVLCSVLPVLAVGFNVFYNLNIRFFTDMDDFSILTAETAIYEESRQESFDANGVTVQFHGYRVYETTEGDYCLETYSSAYANNPFDEVQNIVLSCFDLTGSALENTMSGGGGSSGSGGGYTASDRYEIAKGDTDMVLSRDQYGVTWETNITIDWEGVA